MSSSIKFPYIPSFCKLKFVSANNIYIKEAYKYAKKHSTERRHPTGMVIVKDKTIVAYGANQAKLRKKILQRLHRRYCIRKLLHVPTGRSYWLCPGCADYSFHAEVQAVEYARKRQINLLDSDAYLWGHWWCCQNCSNVLEKAGIRQIYLLQKAHILFNRNNKFNKIGDFAYFDKLFNLY